MTTIDKMSYIEKQTVALAAIYDEVKGIKWLANFNAVVLAVMMFYLIINGIAGVILAINFLLFFINAIFFISKQLTARGNK